MEEQDAMDASGLEVDLQALYDQIRDEVQALVLFRLHLARKLRDESHVISPARVKLARQG